MTKLRFGILGTARIARTNVRAIKLSKNAEVVAIGSRSIESANEFIKENEIPNAKAYGSYEEVVQDPNVDAVYIPLPSDMHVEWVNKCADAKKHILLEKPVASSCEDTKAILEKAKSSGIVLMDGTMWMHNDRVPEMKKVLTDGRLGNIESFIACFNFCGDEEFFKNDIRTKGDKDKLGCLGDVGWYCIRANLWAFGWDLPKSVQVHHGAKFNEEGVPMKLGASMIWEDGRVGQFYCSFLDGLRHWFEASGSLGQLRVDDFYMPVREKEAAFTVITGSKFDEGKDGEGIQKKDEDRQVIPQSAPQNVKMFDDFADLVNGKGNPEEWLEMTRKTQQVLLAIYESAKNNGRIVEVEQEPRR